MDLALQPMREPAHKQNGYNGVLGGLMAATTSSKLNHRDGDWNMAAAEANRNTASAAAAAATADAAFT